MTKQSSFRVITRGEDGDLRIKSYCSEQSILDTHTQIGVDDCSTNLSLRGLPVFRGLIGPMADTDGIVRYESPDVFEALTKEWSAAENLKRKRRRRTKKAEDASTEEATVEESPTI